MLASAAMGNPRPWTVLDTELVQDGTIIRLHRDRVRAPRSGAVHPYWRIEADEWVNVVPVTDDGQVVMVRQWRHGTREITLEIPGGIVDPGETPAQAAARETLEESGYGGGELVALGALDAESRAVRESRPHLLDPRRASRRGDPEPRRRGDRRGTGPARRPRPARAQRRDPARARGRGAPSLPPGREATRDVARREGSR